MTDIHLLTDDLLPIEEEMNEWRRSRKEGICGIVNCYYNKPITQCKKCTNYYCSEHFPSHLDLLPDGDLEYSNTNEGLECYMDEINDKRLTRV